MGMIDRIPLIGRNLRAAGRAVGGVLRAVRPDATRQMELDHEALRDARAQFTAEFRSAPGDAGRRSRFDQLVDALNRLPRPILAFGTIGLFVDAMVAPEAFALRMRGLALVPDPLWWLLGAIVSFYFGARELDYARRTRQITRQSPPAAPSHRAGATRADTNPALEEWVQSQDR